MNKEGNWKDTRSFLSRGKEKETLKRREKENTSRRVEDSLIEDLEVGFLIKRIKSTSSSHQRKI